MMNQYKFEIVNLKVVSQIWKYIIPKLKTNEIKIVSNYEFKTKYMVS